jgi:hypothetical protein
MPSSLKHTDLPAPMPLSHTLHHHTTCNEGATQHARKATRQARKVMERLRGDTTSEEGDTTSKEGDATSEEGATTCEEGDAREARCRRGEEDACERGGSVSE